MAGNDGRKAFPFVPVETFVSIAAAGGGVGSGVCEPGTDQHSLNLDYAIAVGPTEVVAGRCRGRPRGARNKPRPNTIIPNDNRVLDVQSGCDVVECLATYARRCGHGFFILSGGGIVTDVKLRRLGHDDFVQFLPGYFEIVYLGGSILPPSTLPGESSLKVLLADSVGQLFAGAVVGPLIAVSNVNVTGNVFSRVLHVQLPLLGEEGVPEAQQLPDSSQNPGGGAARLQMLMARLTADGHSYSDPAAPPNYN